ncbi:MAG: pyridoxamine 5'-phosphate oxidase family protein [Cyanobacteriota bacterium]|nr:pyridoxamine 5'-phosphate oxidase family protein [Cyanobacteriota bacterium]
MPPLETLHQLITSESVASLAVLQEGSPLVTLVPYVVLWDPLRIYLLISDLSPHTAALRTDDRCSLLIHEPPQMGDPRSNHALARTTLQGRASFLVRREAVDLGVEALYRQKYEIADMILGLADFHFCQITPTTGTFIQGFGKAFQLQGSNLDQLQHLTGR